MNGLKAIGAEQQRRIGKGAQGKGALRCHHPCAVDAKSIQPFERRERDGVGDLWRDAPPSVVVNNQNNQWAVPNGAR